MKAREIRKKFLDYFARHGHQVVSSSALVPRSDPSLMFTNAGMVPFKDVFLGRESRPYSRAATCQKCIRISGKHNDLENVGRTSRHHTFFEMLGNFSFGDYFKTDAIRFGWDLLTTGYGLSPDRLIVTVFQDDDDAAAIWRKEIGVPENRIFRCGAKDNFWAMGDTGPCGPCSEIHYDRGPAFGEASPENGERYFELWNLVFMQFERRAADGPLEPLPKPSIDTGAGLERIASVLQQVDSNFDTDLFQPLIRVVGEAAGKPYRANPEDDVSMRVAADHARMAAFLIAEGVFPEKTGREYVLRRVLRRAIRHGHRLGITRPFMHDVALEVVRGMGADYPELAEHRALIEEVVKQEETRFRQTLQRGLELLDANKEWLHDARGKVLPGAVAFKLYDTFGFPDDLIEVIGQEQGFVLDRDGFEQAMTAQRERSVWKGSGEEKVSGALLRLAEQYGTSAFEGYEREALDDAKVLAVLCDGALVDQAAAGTGVDVLLDRTPFYGEGGGQVGDAGTLEADGLRVEVSGAHKPAAGLIVHRGTVRSGTLRQGATVRATIDVGRRAAIRRNHTATHLLHWALRSVLGAHATQKGSLVAPDRFRFDYSHFEPLTTEQARRIEELANGAILANHEVRTELTDPESARRQGAMAIFEEKYGDVVRLVRAAPESLELCGGTHARRTGDLGLLKIVAESGIAAGVRRIEAVTGAGALAHVWTLEEQLGRAAAALRSAPPEVPERVEKLLGRERELVREIADLKRRLSLEAMKGPAVAGGGEASSAGAGIREIAGVRVHAVRVEVGEPKVMRELADALRGKLGSGVVVLGGVDGGKANLLVAATPDVQQRVSAGKLVRELAGALGARGGGKDDLAQAGGGEPAKLDATIQSVYSVVERMLGHG
ncbi:MAG: alanine--tRNA ligase [Deltaproteobacteria bacterium]|nr:alanine--tRNA ligase [Deltaproteobacteria bacterium]